MRKTHTFCKIQNKLLWHINRFCAVVQFLKRRRKFIFFYFTLLVHNLLLLGSQQYPQSGVLASFSIWGTENSLA